VVYSWLSKAKDEMIKNPLLAGFETPELWTGIAEVMASQPEFFRLIVY